jgi:superoxide reductase
MTQRFQIYRCDICGNMVKVTSVGRGELVCCEKPMRLLEEKTEGAERERHVPLIEKIGIGIRVRIGTASHPMEDRHFIEWIEVRSGPVVMVQSFTPGEKAEAEFPLPMTDVKARCYCTVHELWANK